MKFISKSCAIVAYISLLVLVGCGRKVPKKVNFDGFSHENQQYISSAKKSKAVVKKKKKRRTFQIINGFSKIIGAAFLAFIAFPALIIFNIAGAYNNVPLAIASGAVIAGSSAGASYATVSGVQDIVGYNNNDLDEVAHIIDA